jgi:curved DNA-binding protein CbpA
MNEEDIREIQDIDLYKILEVDISETNENIKKSYRKLVLQHHPDKNGGDRSYFELITLAYTILSNEDYRELYDKIRSNYISDYISLKYDNKKEIKRDPIYDTYESLTEKLNKNHGYIEDTDILDIKTTNTKLNNIIISRGKEEKEIKFETINEKPFICSEIVAFNENSLLNSVKNYDKLYDTGASLIDECFTITKKEEYIDDKKDLRKKMIELQQLYR